ncbi:MAG TPA: hypothetical protein VMB21_18885 [Candidatus Limnocylindria bacterium]|nr:hypothetical protein [Candidatus Limnocylindria bacterium]
MSSEQMLEIMAHVDGELDAGHQARVQQLLGSDADAAALHRELAQMRQLVRSHEPAGCVPDTREFYWSQIQRRIESEARATARVTAPKSGVLTWLRWLAPALGVAAVAVIVVLQQSSPKLSELANAVDSTQPEATSLTFRSDADGVTVHWIN